ncbi:MAG: ATPase, T2SS/T4P/T4SS family, partial [Sulfurimicrobium sp.]
MVAAAPPTSLSGLARSLVQQGLLLDADAEMIQAQAKASNIGFVSQLILSNKLGAAQIAEFASRNFGFPLLDLNAISIDHLPKGIIDPATIQSRRVLPLHQRGTHLFIATSDPTNLQTINDLRFQTNHTVEQVVVEDDKLGKLIEKVVASSDTSLKSMSLEDMGELEFTNDEAQEKERQNENASIEIDDAPVVKYLQKILMDAINTGVSDIHFEPYEKFFRIRYRLDGTLYEAAQPPLAIKDKISSRIKVISKLDIAERRVPQDGRMKLVLSRNRAIDFRVSTLPTLYGEKIVMRILDPASATLGIDALGYEPDQRELLLAAVQRPYGMVLVTGPTGSGKTVSLYTCLNILNKPGVNISTVRDTG